MDPEASKFNTAMYLGFTPFLCLVGILANLLLLLALSKNNVFGHTYYNFLSAMAALDLTALLFTLPVIASRCPVCDFRHAHISGVFIVFVLVGLQKIFIVSSCWTVLFLAFDLCLHTFHRKRKSLISRLRVSSPWLLIFLISMMSIVETLPSFWYYQLDEGNGLKARNDHQAVFFVYNWLDVTATGILYLFFLCIINAVLIWRSGVRMGAKSPIITSTNWNRLSCCTGGEGGGRFTNKIHPHPQSPAGASDHQQPQQQQHKEQQHKDQHMLPENKPETQPLKHRRQPKQKCCIVQQPCSWATLTPSVIFHSNTDNLHRPSTSDGLSISLEYSPQTPISTICNVDLTSINSCPFQQPSINTTTGPQPCISTINNPQPSTNTIYNPQPSTSTTNNPQPSTSTVYNPQPSISTVYNPQPSTSTINNPQTSTSTVYNLQPSISTIDNPQPPISTIDNPQPPISTINNPQPPISTIHTLQPSTSTIQSPRTPISTTQNLHSHTSTATCQLITLDHNPHQTNTTTPKSPTHSKKRRTKTTTTTTTTTTNNITRTPGQHHTSPQTPSPHISRKQNVALSALTMFDFEKEFNNQHTRYNGDTYENTSAASIDTHSNATTPFNPTKLHMYYSTEHFLTAVKTVTALTVLKLLTLGPGIVLQGITIGKKGSDQGSYSLYQAATTFLVVICNAGSVLIHLVINADLRHACAMTLARCCKCRGKNSPPDESRTPDHHNHHNHPLRAASSVLSHASDSATDLQRAFQLHHHPHHHHPHNPHHHNHHHHQSHHQSHHHNNHHHHHHRKASDSDVLDCPERWSNHSGLASPRDTIQFFREQAEFEQDHHQWSVLHPQAIRTV